MFISTLSIGSATLEFKATEKGPVWTSVSFPMRMVRTNQKNKEVSRLLIKRHLSELKAPS